MVYSCSRYLQGRCYANTVLGAQINQVKTKQNKIDNVPNLAFLQFPRFRQKLTSCGFFFFFSFKLDILLKILTIKSISSLSNYILGNLLCYPQHRKRFMCLIYSTEEQFEVGNITISISQRRKMRFQSKEMWTERGFKELAPSDRASKGLVCKYG